MPFEKGHVRYGGRAKGTPNKGISELKQRAKEIGIDPFDVLLYFAKGDWKSLGYNQSFITRVGKGGETYDIERITPEMRMKAAGEAAQYLHPKLKAIEHSGDIGTSGDERPLGHLTDEELEKL